MKAMNIWFNHPVEAQLVPDYYNVVKKPMDLGTVQSKLQRKQYTMPGEFYSVRPGLCPVAAALMTHRAHITLPSICKPLAADRAVRHLPMRAAGSQPHSCMLEPCLTSHQAPEHCSAVSSHCPSCTSSPALSP